MTRNEKPKLELREPYPTWIVLGMDVLAAGILMASFRDAWVVVSGLGAHAGDMSNAIVAGAVVLAIDASVLLLEQARSQVKLRGGQTLYSDAWVGVLILLSAILNVRYLTSSGELLDRCIGGLLGIAIPSTIAVLGYLKGDMLAFNTQVRLERKLGMGSDHRVVPPTAASAPPAEAREAAPAPQPAPAAAVEAMPTSTDEERHVGVMASDDGPRQEAEPTSGSEEDETAKPAASKPMFRLRRPEGVPA